MLGLAAGRKSEIEMDQIVADLRWIVGCDRTDPREGIRGQRDAPPTRSSGVVASRWIDWPDRRSISVMASYSMRPTERLSVAKRIDMPTKGPAIRARRFQRLARRRASRSSGVRTPLS